MSAKKKRIIITAVVLAVTVLFCFRPIVEFFKDINLLKSDPKGDFLCVLSVGEADAILVHSKGKTALIDTGDAKDAGNSLAVKLKRMGIEKIDTVILTHNHTDHIGGLYSVLGQFDVGCLYYQDLYEEDASQELYFSSLQDIISENKVITGFIKENMTFKIGNFSFCVLASGQINLDGDLLNDASAVIKAECKGKSFLLMADAGEYIERYIIEKYKTLKCDVVKVGHHGSATSCSDFFINNIKPKYAAISCGDQNTYGHPASKTLAILENYNVQVLRTDKDGDIYFRLDDYKNLWVETIK